MTTELLTIGGLAVFLALLMQAIKPAIKSELVPVVAVVLGVVIAVLASWVTDLTGKQQLADAVLTGVYAGFAAIGAYSAQHPTGVLKSKGE